MFTHWHIDDDLNTFSKLWVLNNICFKTVNSVTVHDHVSFERYRNW